MKRETASEMESSGTGDSAQTADHSGHAYPKESIIEVTLNGGSAVRQPDVSEFDFKARVDLPIDFPGSYLRQYYGLDRPVTDDETAVYDFIVERVVPRLTGKETCIEIGCGPTVHHAIMLSPLISKITLADYLEGNLEYIETWRRNDVDAWDWGRYTAFCIEKDGGDVTEDKIEAREEMTRQKMTESLPINILKEHPLADRSLKFDVASVFYCSEEVALTVSRWQEAMRSITSLIKDGGYLLMSCLYDSDFYHILGADNQVKVLPCARIDEDTLRTTLENLDFVITPESIKLVRTPEQEAEGVPGVLLVFARKGIKSDALT